MTTLNPVAVLARDAFIRAGLAKGTNQADIAVSLKMTKQAVNMLVRRHHLDKPHKLQLNADERHYLQVAHKNHISITVGGIEMVTPTAKVAPSSNTTKAPAKVAAKTAAVPAKAAAGKPATKSPVPAPKPKGAPLPFGNKVTSATKGKPVAKGKK